jgi:hypothetical protein
VSQQTLTTAIGWREWVALPDLGIAALKAKVDTGARTSSLHAVEIEEFQRRRATWLRFRLLPYQRDTAHVVTTEARLAEYRHVRSSTGHLSYRPVIVTPISIFGETWPIELTLTNRVEMGFRMLLGREALRGRFFVDPGRSYLGGVGPTSDHDRHVLSLRGQRTNKRRKR